jgi:hypothetical protein
MNEGVVMKKLAIIGLLVLALTAVLTGTASAARDTFNVNCSESGLLVVETSEGIWSVAQIVGSKGHFIPVSFNGEVTVDGAVVESFSDTKKGHQNQGPTETCTINETFEEDGQTIVFTGEAEVVRRPK